MEAQYNDLFSSGKRPYIDYLRSFNEEKVNKKPKSLSKTNQVILVEQWIEESYFSGTTPPAFKRALAQALELAVAYQQEVKAKEIKEVRRTILWDMIGISVFGFLGTMLLFDLFIGFYGFIVPGPWVVYKMMDIIAPLFLLGISLIVPIILRIHFAVRESFALIATPLSDERMLRRLQSIYERFTGGEQSPSVTYDDPVGEKWEQLKKRFKIKISERFLWWAGWAFLATLIVITGIINWDIVKLLNGKAGVNPDLKAFVFAFIRLFFTAGIFYFVVRTFVLAQSIFAMKMHRSTEGFFKKILLGIFVFTVQWTVVLSLWPYGYGGAAFVFFIVTGILITSLQILHHAAKYFNDYNVRLHPVGDLLYGLMTSRRVYQAQGVIEHIIKECQTQQKLDLEDRQIFATVLSRILLNPSVCRHAQIQSTAHREKYRRARP